jgi:type VI secretion system protein VasD
MTPPQGVTLGLVALAAAYLAGCGGSPPPPPPPPPPLPPVLELTVTGSADQNPGTDGTPQPVAMHLYQLAATAKFTNADVFALIEHEQATLGADDLGSSEFVLKPSEKQDVKQDLKAGTKAIGVVAWFRDIDNAQWRASAPVAANGPSKLVLEVAKLSVSLKPAGK